MRILHIVHQYLPSHVGGTELYTQTLSQAQDKRGHHVTVFYRGRGNGVKGKKRVEKKVHIWQVQVGHPSPTRLFLDTFGAAPITRAFKPILKKTEPDLVHVQHLMGLPVDLVDLIQRDRIPYVITLHDYWWICPNAQLLTNDSQNVCDGPQAYVNCARCALARIERPGLWPMVPPLAALLCWRNRLLRRVLQNAQHLIAPTPFVKRWYAQQGVLPHRISIIPHGIDWPDLPEKTVREHNVPIRFVYIGGLSWQKGVHIVVQALKGVHGAELWIAGNESFDPDYTAWLHELASPNMQFLGQLSRAQVWETLSQADAVVVPSLWYETFGLIVQEAFAAGVPVIASDHGALAEAVTDGVDGLLVPPGDVGGWQKALHRLVDDADLLAYLKSNVQPPPTLEEHVDRIEHVYRSLTIDG